MTMFDAKDPQWLEQRVRERAAARRAKRLASRTPGVVLIDAGKFGQQISDLAQTLTNKVDREGASAFGSHPMQGDVAAILVQLRETYNLIRFVNADETRDENHGYRMSYSFVILPLVRTMIDGFYNCTAMLDDPSRVRQFRISGLYRIRESIEADESRYGNDPQWKLYLSGARQDHEARMRIQGFTQADLDNKANKWPLLGEYLAQKPDTPHRQMIRRMTLGFWKEYSSISHASHDGILSIFRFIASDQAAHEIRPVIADAAERHLAVHLGRAAGVLLCLLTEIQWYCKFDGSRIDERLYEMWAAMHPVVEVRELFEYRYNRMLRHPISLTQSL